MTNLAREHLPLELSCDLGLFLCKALEFGIPGFTHLYYYLAKMIAGRI